MTNGQINFVHDLVQMAKAFEELPQVRRELDAAHSQIEAYAKQVQRLELRLIDLKTDLDAAHAATRKAEVERDHAEQMFLETDDRLNAFQRLLRSFQADAGALVKAAEPAPTAEGVSGGQSAGHPTASDAGTTQPGASAQSSELSPASVEFHGDATNVDSVSSGPQGSREAGEQSQSPAVSSDMASASEHSAPISDTAHESHDSEGVSVQRDPTPASPVSPDTSAPVNGGQHGAGNTSESAWPGSSEASLQRSEEGVPAAGTLYPADPTASSPAGNTPTPSSAPTDAAVSVADAPAAYAPVEPALDDVGYHNEPAIRSNELGGWDAWDAWSARMDKRYGSGRWPTRPIDKPMPVNVAAQ